MQANLTSWASFHQRPGSVHVLAIRLMAVVLLALVIGPAFAAGPTAASQGDGNGEVAIAGELRQWHKVTLTLDGPWARESDDGPNPFTDCRLTVTFRHESGSPQYVVPGYFAADGDAANHSADSGTKWRAHLSPDKTGRWSYHVSFVQDGKLDIIIGGAKGPLVWYRNPDWQKSVIADGGYNTVAGAAADVDGDGDLDIALGGVVWLENPGPKGDPAKDPWPAHEVEKRRGHDLLAADLDDAGKVDLIMRDQSAFSSKSGHSIFLYKQITPTQWTMRELRCGEGEGIRVADLNGDGRPDIVIGGSWFENSGDLLNGPWTEHVFTAEWNYPHTKVAVGDLNGDGRPDIILAPAELKGGSHRIAWYERRPTPKPATGNSTCLRNRLKP